MLRHVTDDYVIPNMMYDKSIVKIIRSYCVNGISRPTSITNCDTDNHEGIDHWCDKGVKPISAMLSSVDIENSSVHENCCLFPEDLRARGVAYMRSVLCVTRPHHRCEPWKYGQARVHCRRKHNNGSHCIHASMPTDTGQDCLDIVTRPKMYERHIMWSARCFFPIIGSCTSILTS